MTRYSGLPVSAGIACGEVLVYTPAQPKIVEQPIARQNTAAMVQQLRQAYAAAIAEVTALHGRLLQQKETEKAGIMAAHREILEDEEITEETVQAVQQNLHHPTKALRDILGSYISLMESAKDERMRQRAADLRDVRRRLLCAFYGMQETPLATLTKPVVLITHDLYPSDTAQMAKEKVVAIVTEVGGETSHSAIIARSNRIPAIAGVKEATTLLHTGQQVVVDALEGAVITGADAEMLASYQNKQAIYMQKRHQEDAYLYKTARTKDGVRVEVELNIGSDDTAELQAAAYTDGVGLFRSEFLFMQSGTLPDEDTQFTAYKNVLKAFGTRPVVLRTLDIGGDKQLPGVQLPAEMNPFLGNRALRLCFSNPALFHTQLRAALRAAVYGNLWLMFPMVGSLNDIIRAKKALQSARHSLQKEGVAYGDNIKVGIMVEIPSIALLAHRAAELVDFASIGTNDLSQYTLAVDRMNPAVSSYYQKYHPAVLHLIHGTVQAFVKAGKPVGVCGELGGDPLAIPALMGFGLRRLSMHCAAVAAAKKVICNIALPQAQQLSQSILGCDTAQDVQALLQKFYTEIL